MKVALALAFALFALSLPVAAADTVQQTAPAQPAAIEQAKTFDVEGYCWDFEGRACGPVGSTRGCYDVCNYHYTCTCTQPWYGGSPIWICPYTC